MKDLTTISKTRVNLAKVVIVDNMPINFTLQRENGIEISGWENDIKDREIVKLERILIGLLLLDDVRVGIRNIGGKIPGLLLTG